jgi:hypothetical protein
LEQFLAVAYVYYAKYPSLGLLYWPPHFHMVEGLFFLVFGIAVVSSHLTILAYALMGVYRWYKVAAREGPQSRALASTFIFLLLLVVLEYERVTITGWRGVAGHIEVAIARSLVLPPSTFCCAANLVATPGG